MVDTRNKRKDDMTKIEKDRLYTLNEIVKDGLLLRRDGITTIRTMNMARRIVMLMGHKSIYEEGLQQIRWRIPGKDLIAYNERVKKAK